jgi:hypothetical protein
MHDVGNVASIEPEMLLEPQEIKLEVHPDLQFSRVVQCLLKYLHKVNRRFLGPRVATKIYN